MFTGPDAGWTTVARLGSLLALAAALVAAASHQQPREWRDYAGGPDSSRFVAATQITKANVGQLQVAWTYPSGQTDFNPLVVRGVVYGRGANDSFVALDAATGKQIWVHEGVNGFNSRGVNYWESKDGTDRRLIFSANNFLQAIDARTGQTIRSFGVDGRVDMRVGLDRDPETVNQQSRLPGRVFENLIILGSATNQEYDSAPGDIRAYDVRTGTLVWTFHTVPRPGEFGYDTWPEGAWKTVGGANNWGEQSIDEKRGIVYVPTGSPKFNFYGGNRKGANLFSDCLVALDARTGKRLWHFQTVHHDIWDLDNNSAPQLTTIRRKGRMTDVVAMAGKTGYLYVFDRVTGEPIWPIEERPVPQTTTVPGEALWPTQPFPTAPPPFSRQRFTAEDVNPYILTPEEREHFKKRVANARNEGPFTPIGFEDVIHMPGNQGGSNWGSTAANPADGTVYVIGFNVPTIIRLLRAGEVHRGRDGTPTVVREGRYLTQGFGLYPAIVNPPYTTLTAYDLNAGTIRWQIGLGDDLRLVDQGVRGTGAAAMVKGGLIPTATGLLFATAADRKIHVYDSTTGEQLSEFPLGGATSGSPSMYEYGGRQYLLVTASRTAQAPDQPGPVGIVAYALPAPAADLQGAVDEFQTALNERWSYRHANDADFDGAIATLRKKAVAGMSMDEFGLELHRILALGIDGHSGVVGYQLPGRFLPFLIEPDGERFIAFKPDRTAFLAEGFPYLTQIDGKDVSEWCSAAAVIVPKGSQPYRRHRCLARLRNIDFVRDVMKLPRKETVDVALSATGSGIGKTVTLRTADALPTYGVWPRGGSRVLDGNIGYLRLPSMAETSSLREINEWMPQFRNTRALIIDIRDNDGGDRDALRVLYSYLAAPTDPPRVVNAAAYRLHKAHKDDHLAGDHAMFRADAAVWSEAHRQAIAEFARRFKPRWELPKGQFSEWHYMVLSRRNDPDMYHYDKPVVVLMNGKCFSATDIFLAGLKGMKNVTLLGTASAGGSANTQEVALAGTPIRVRIASMASFQADGRLFDGHGVHPDVVVHPTQEYYVGGPDNVLSAAMKRLGGHLRGGS